LPLVPPLLWGLSEHIGVARVQRGALVNAMTLSALGATLDGVTARTGRTSRWVPRSLPRARAEHWSGLQTVGRRCIRSSKEWVQWPPPRRREASVRMRCAPQDSFGANAGEKDGDGDVGSLVSVGLAFVLPALGGLLFGYDIGATSGALVNLQSEATGPGWGSALTPLQSGLLTSGSLAGALLGSGVGFLVGDKVGRRREILASAISFVVGAVVTGVSSGFAGVLSGRLAFGLGIGLAMHGVPAYIAETSASSMRGALISAKEGFIVGGILLGYVASFVWAEDPDGWRSMYLASLAFSLPYTLGPILWLPESPRWLLLNRANAGGDKDDEWDEVIGEAEKALVRVRGFNATAPVPQSLRREVAEIEASLRDRSILANDDGSDDRSVLLAPRNRRALAVGSSLILFQQITGQPSVLYYASTVFQGIGFRSAAAAAQVSVGLGLLKLLMTGVAVANVDKAGRRPLLLVGVGGLTASLFVLSATLGGALDPFIGEGSSAYVSVASLLAFVSFYQVSFGPISWLMVSELFPLRVRSKAIGFSTMLNFGTNWVVTLALPSVQAAVGTGPTFLAFGCIGCVALATIYSIVPETKGKTLEEIEAQFAAMDKTK